MARRRYYRRVYRTAPKKKWASNIKPGILRTGQLTSELVVNSSASSTPTPVIVKAGNFKIQGDCNVLVTDFAYTPRVYLFLMFLPEGNTVSSTITNAHPEWVMGWTALDFSNVTEANHTVAGNKFSITSRLKRNLNSGDKIVLYLQTDSEAVQPAVNFIAQFFTCAN